MNPPIRRDKMGAGGSTEHMNRIFQTAAAAVLALTAVSCASVPDKVNPLWSEEMFFKNAQDAVDEDRVKTALFYYEVYLVRYPENPSRGIAAEYSRSFLFYKMGKYEEAEAGFNAIIAKYDDSPYAMLYHPRFKILAEKGLDSIEKTQFTKNRLFWRAREKRWAEENDESLVDDGTGEFS